MIVKCTKPANSFRLDIFSANKWGELKEKVNAEHLKIFPCGSHIVRHIVGGISNPLTIWWPPLLYHPGLMQYHRMIQVLCARLTYLVLSVSLLVSVVMNWVIWNFLHSCPGSFIPTVGGDPHDWLKLRCFDYLHLFWRSITCDCRLMHQLVKFWSCKVTKTASPSQEFFSLNIGRAEVDNSSVNVSGCNWLIVRQIWGMWSCVVVG